MPNLVRALYWALIGNVIIGFGAGTATLAAFSPSLPLLNSPHFILRVTIVSIGFAFFFAGYHATQVGTYRDEDESVRVAMLPDPILGMIGEEGSLSGNGSGGIDHHLLLRGMFIITGVFGLGAGMRLFALTIQAWSPVLGVVTGFVCIAGYIAGHIGINGVLI